MKNVCIIGNSIVAGVAQGMVSWMGVDDLLRFQGRWNFTKIAFPAENITQQRARWATLSSALKLTFDYVVTLDGHNDTNSTFAIADWATKYQGQIDDIRAAIKASCKIISMTLTPCRDVYIDIYGAVPGEAAYQKWLLVNEAIRGEGANAITGADTIITGHTDYLNDGTGSMKDIYWTAPTDHLHPNRAGKDVIADFIKPYLI